MSGLLGRELTKEEGVVAAWLQTMLEGRSQSRGAGPAIRQMAVQAPERLCPAALAVLEERADEDSRRWLYTQLIEGPEFLLQLMNPERFSRPQLAAACRSLLAIDEMLDVRLARLLPSRRENSHGLSRETVVHVLDVLDEISPGGRLILLLNHLTRHPDPSIAAKATLLIGKRLHNQDWVARQLESPDGRVRASVMEGLWNTSTAAARTSLWAALKDKNNRVVGNALIGLHQLGEVGVSEFVKRMIEDSRPPFRWTAAWVMGKLGGEEFAEFLERALKDTEAQVRRAAEQALHAIRQTAAAGPPDAAPHPSAKPAVPRAMELPPPRDLNIQFGGNYISSLTRRT